MMRSVLLATGGGTLDPADVLAALRAGLHSSFAGLGADGVLGLRWDGSGLVGSSGPAVGVVVREVHGPGGGPVREVLALDHPCLECAVREDLVSALEATDATHPGSAVVVLLPPGADPRGARAVLQQVRADLDVRLVGLVAVVDRPSLLSDAGGEETLADRGWQQMPDDDGGVADALLRQLERAGALLLVGPPAHAPIESALLGWLAPNARQVECADLGELAGTGLSLPLRSVEPGWVDLLQRHDHALGQRGHLLLADRGVGCLLWRARGPLHPQRLHDAMQTLMDGCLRSRGHLWLPARPQQCVSWDHAGLGLRLHCGPDWVAAAGPERWLQLSEEQRGWLDAHWHPRYGDRFQELVLIGTGHSDGPSPQHLIGLLEDCLLADDDPRAPLDWAGSLEDPFAGHLSS